jgi:acetyl-CoA decarbonylase/synthase complex subunit gamma
MDENLPGFQRWLETTVGPVPVVSSTLSVADTLGRWKARWGIGRMSYLVPPGLYAIGAPSANDAVVVTANYKMSYDLVRAALAGRNIWLLVLETYGINVWCAAGKGTFGTREVIFRLGKAGLAQVVDHRRLILPLFGATGVAAHVVKKETGFTVIYSVVNVADLPDYLDGTHNQAAREVTFTFFERLAVVPVDLREALWKSYPAYLLFFFVGSFRRGSFSLIDGSSAILAVLLGIVIGTIVVPVFLPWLPGRPFSLKGFIAGVLITAPIAASFSLPLSVSLAFVLGVATISAFWALNFTGSTPFTSQSGVKKELRVSLPLMALALGVALAFMTIGILRAV